MIYLSPASLLPPPSSPPRVPPAGTFTLSHSLPLHSTLTLPLLFPPLESVRARERTAASLGRGDGVSPRGGGEEERSGCEQSCDDVHSLSSVRAVFVLFSYFLYSR